MTDTTRLPEADTENQTVPARGVRVVHLVFGVLFLGITAIWGLAANDVLRFDVNLAIVFPVVLILAGVAGLVGMVANSGRRKNADPYSGS